MSHIIAIDLNPLEVEFDQEVVRDATEFLFGNGPSASVVEDEFKAALQDAVVDAIADLIRDTARSTCDFIIRVEQPTVPPVPLVKSITTVPF